MAKYTELLDTVSFISADFIIAGVIEIMQIALIFVTGFLCAEEKAKSGVFSAFIPPLNDDHVWLHRV
jgi:hypothetical protein